MVMKYAMGLFSAGCSVDNSSCSLAGAPNGIAAAWLLHVQQDAEVILRGELAAVRQSMLDVSDIFIFSARGKGESEAPGGEGSVFLLKIPHGVGGGGPGAGRVSAANCEVLGGGGG